MITNKGKIAFIASIVLFAVVVEAVSSVVFPRIPVTLIQPDGKKVDLLSYYIYGENNKRIILYETKKKRIPVIKNKQGFYMLATIARESNISPIEIYNSTGVRADSPIAIKKKIGGKWCFFIPSTNQEVFYNTRIAILPDWPDYSTASWEGWFTGIFNPDGSPIYYKSEKIKQSKTYRTPFAGSINIWILIVLTSILFLKKRGVFKVGDNKLL